MPGPRFDPTVSLGNILTAGALLVAVTVSWADTNAKGTANRDAIANLQAQSSDREARIRALETTVAALTANFGNIRETLGEMKSDLRRLVEGDEP